MADESGAVLCDTLARSPTDFAETVIHLTRVEIVKMTTTENENKKMS